jgi:hypothetical protein
LLNFGNDSSKDFVQINVLSKYNKMKPLITLILLFALCNTSLPGQAVFQKIYGGSQSDWAESAQQTTDDGFIITGATNSFTSEWYHDLYLLRTDAYGSLQWAKTYGGPEGNEEGNSVLQTDDDGFIIAGSTSFGPGGANVYLLRTNAEGDTLWTKTFGGEHNDIAESIQETADGGFIFVGRTGGGTTTLDYDVLLAKMNSSGDILWAKSYGGSNNDYGKAVQQTNDGGYIIIGEGASFGLGTWEIYLMKTDGDGNIIWSKTYGDIRADFAFDVQQTNDGEYLLSGYYSGTGIDDTGGLLIKTDPDGNIIWTKLYGAVFYSIKEVPEGGYILAGNMAGNACLVKTDASGDTLWTNTYGGSEIDEAKSLILANDGTYVMAGSFRSPPINPMGNIYLIKTDAYGNSGCFEEAREIFVTDVEISTTIPIFQISDVGFSGSAATEINEGGRESTLCFTTNVEESQVLKNELTISPNPFHSETTLQASSELNNASLKIFNSFGQLLIQKNNLTGREIKIKRNNLSLGIYFLQLEDGDIKFKIRKLLVD